MAALSLEEAMRAVERLEPKGRCVFVPSPVSKERGIFTVRSLSEQNGHKYCFVHLVYRKDDKTRCIELIRDRSKSIHIERAWVLENEDKVMVEINDTNKTLADKPEMRMIILL